MKDFSQMRRNMVQSQLETNKVTDPSLLAAFLRIPRELFFPDHLVDLAYSDEDVETAPGRYMMEPMVLARLIQAAAINPRDIVLDIGGVNGYAAAILSQRAGVISLECDSSLAHGSRENLAKISIDTVEVVEGPLQEGYPDQAPYDVIILGGAVREFPVSLTDQLSEGGRLLGVIRSSEPGCGRAVCALRSQDHVTERELFDAHIPFLPGFPGPDAWVF